MDRSTANRLCDTVKSSILEHEEKATFGRCGRALCKECCQLSYVFVIVSFVTIGTAVLWNWQQTVLLEQQIAELKEQRDEIGNRGKRESERYDDTYHEMLYHHGIHSRSIAHYYGDVARLRNTSGTDDRLVFVRSDIPSVELMFPRCYHVMRNGHKQFYCLQKNVGGFIFCTSAELTTYPYFMAAPWMEDTPANRANFKMEEDGRIRIMTNGTYLVYANIQFLTYGRYTVKLESAKGDHKDISNCVVPSCCDDHEHLPSACSTQLPMMLCTGDRVAMSIQPYADFLLEKENFYFGLIKLNDYSI